MGIIHGTAVLVLMWRQIQEECTSGTSHFFVQVLKEILMTCKRYISYFQR